LGILARVAGIIVAAALAGVLVAMIASQVQSL